MYLNFILLLMRWLFLILLLHYSISFYHSFLVVQGTRSVSETSKHTVKPEITHPPPTRTL